MATNTIRLHRILRAKPERVYRAFLDPNALVKWLPPNLPGTMETTITLRGTPFGTELNVVQEGIPAAIPVEACYLGWQDSLVLLAQLVEPEIPG